MLDLDGSLDGEYLPIYDGLGNLAAVTDAAGTLIERYEYSPFGERRIFVDSTPPAVAQVRVVGDELWIELSEEVRTGPVAAALTADELKLSNLTDSTAATLALELAATDGPAGRRRWVLRDDDATGVTWPEPGEQARLELPAGALRDLFGNQAAAGLSLDFTWPAADEVIDDTAAPRVEQVCVTADGELEIVFSEPPDEASAAAEISLDGAALAWVASADGYTLTSTAALAAGSHTLTIGTGALDLAGLGLATAFGETFTVATGGSPRQSVYRAPSAYEASASTIGNLFGFQGLPLDPETGFYYVRHRYYDPAMGRFVSADPLGYADGPNPYQFALNDPVNFSDPMGLESQEIMQRHRDLAQIDGNPYYFTIDYTPVVELALEALAKPEVQGTLMMIGGCLEAAGGTVGVVAGAPTVAGSIAAGAAVVHGTDLCLTGLAILRTGEYQDPYLIDRGRAGLMALGVDETTADWTVTIADLALGVGAVAKTGASAGRLVSRRRGAPKWLRDIRRGNEFNKAHQFDYPYRELYLDKPGGGYVRLDAYDDVANEIISRKFSQLASVREKTALGYLEELATKYPSGARIADVPSSGPLAGSAVYGRQVLEVPIQTRPVPSPVLERARRLGILIRDVAGKVYP